MPNGRDYSETARYWNAVFSSRKFEIEAGRPIRYPDIENALRWLVRDSAEILDFGFGSGAVPLRCAALGAEKVLGIDISEEAVLSARGQSLKNGLSEKCRFIAGDHTKLTELETGSFGGAVLFNVIDNLRPEDSESVFDELHRILADGGKMLVKLNPLMPRDFFGEGDFTEISEDLYVESSGLIFRNLSDEAFSEMTDGRFGIEKRIAADCGNGMKDRLFYAENLRRR